MADQMEFHGAFPMSYSMIQSYVFGRLWLPADVKKFIIHGPIHGVWNGWIKY